MLLPCALLDTLLSLRALGVFIAPLALGVHLPIVLILSLMSLRVLRLLLLVGLPLLLGALLPIVLVLPLLSLRVLSLLSLGGLPLLLGALLPIVLVLPFRLLSVLRLLLPRVLRRGLGLLMLALLLLRMTLLFARLLMLCVHRSGACQKQRQKGGAGDSNYFHRYLPPLLLVSYACSCAGFRLTPAVAQLLAPRAAPDKLL